MNIYTVVLHKARLILGLSLNEYCVCDSIYHLSNNPKGKEAGWAYITQENLASALGFSERTALEIIKKLVEKGLVETRGHLKRTTPLWYDMVVCRKADFEAFAPKSEETSVFRKVVKSEESSPQKVKKLPTKSEETSLNNNNHNNKDKDESSEALPTWMDKEKWAEWEQHRKEIKKKLTPLTAKKQIKLLSNYIPIYDLIIEQSIQNGWTGLFPEKVDQKMINEAKLKKQDEVRRSQKPIEEEYPELTDEQREANRKKLREMREKLSEKVTA
jgi:DNA-binding Lrp family transcriptional regulator